MNGRNLFFASLIGGVIIGVGITALSVFVIPITGIACCFFLFIWAWLAGIFSAWLYKRLGSSLTPSQGLVVGALAGILGGLIGVLLPLGLVGLAGAKNALNTLNQYLGPDVTGDLETLSLMGLWLMVGICINIALYTTFGALGGLIGGSILKSKPEAVLTYAPPLAPKVTPSASVPPPMPVIESEAVTESVETVITEIQEALAEPTPEEPPAIPEPHKEPEQPPDEPQA